MLGFEVDIGLWPRSPTPRGAVQGRGPQAIELIRGRNSWATGFNAHVITTIDFPRVKLASCGRRSFAYAGPSNWNSLPAHLIDNSLSLSSFRRYLTTFLISIY